MMRSTKQARRLLCRLDTRSFSTSPQSSNQPTNQPTNQSTNQQPVNQSSSHRSSPQSLTSSIYPELPQSINQSLNDLADKILSKDRSSLSRAMTMMESSRFDHRLQATQLLKIIRDKQTNQSTKLSNKQSLYRSSNPAYHRFNSQSINNEPFNARTIRIGISGAPGVGKSCMIEKLGQIIIGQSINQSINHKSNKNQSEWSHAAAERVQQAEAAQAKKLANQSVSTEKPTPNQSTSQTTNQSTNEPKEQSRLAVLAIDPSSHVGGGSILGDRTRMPELSNNPNVFVRSSPSKCSMGGTNTATFDCLELCESAGFDRIIIETVGVGQSEVNVRSMVDCLILVVNPSGGDELQGMKKGIVELADLVVINKADGNLMEAARHTYADYKHAIQLHQALRVAHQSDPHSAEMETWKPRVLMVSSIDPEGESLTKLWQTIQEFDRHSIAQNLKHWRRSKQHASLLAQQLPMELWSALSRSPRAQEIIRNAYQHVEVSGESVRLEAQQCVQQIMEGLQVKK